MLSPSLISRAMSAAPARLTRSRPPLSARWSDSIFATASVIPVNIVKVSFHSEIRAIATQLQVSQRGRFREPTGRDLRHRHPATPDDFGRIKKNHLVDDSRFERRTI